LVFLKSLLLARKSAFQLKFTTGKLLDESMYFVHTGAGNPPMLLVHGFSCDHTDWRNQVEALQPNHSVITCDLRGHGRTPGQPAECTLETYAADVAALLTSLGLSPAVLVGHSLGCRVVLEVARLHPELAAGVVLIEGNCSGAGDPARAEQAMRDKISAVGFPAFAEALFAGMFPQPAAEAAAILAREKKLPPAIGEEFFPRMARWDAGQLDAALRGLRVPLLAIQSTRLETTGKRISLQVGDISPWLEQVRKLVPGASLAIIPGAGHFVQLEAPQRVNQLLAAFVGGIKQRS
jgi:pimeloyl-ACP methyl ester carboxylesterase